MLKMRPPKQYHNALSQPSRPGLQRNLKVANNEWKSERSSKRAPFLAKAKIMLDKYIPHIRNSNPEIRIASSSGRSQ